MIEISHDCAALNPAFSARHSSTGTLQKHTPKKSRASSSRQNQIETWSTSLRRIREASVWTATSKLVVISFAFSPFAVLLLFYVMIEFIQSKRVCTLFIKRLFWSSKTLIVLFSTRLSFYLLCDLTTDIDLTFARSQLTFFAINWDCFDLVDQNSCRGTTMSADSSKSRPNCTRWHTIARTPSPSKFSRQEKYKVYAIQLSVKVATSTVSQMTTRGAAIGCLWSYRTWQTRGWLPSKAVTRL
jgi:hypothetical protein